LILIFKHIKLTKNGQLAGLEPAELASQQRQAALVSKAAN
jgi:hypothetical protein